MSTALLEQIPTQQGMKPTLPRLQDREQYRLQDPL
jgi:hypothetical protein